MAAYAGPHQYSARPDFSIDFEAASDDAAIKAVDHGDLDERMQQMIFTAAVALVHLSSCPCGQGSNEEFVG